MRNSLFLAIAVCMLLGCEPEKELSSVSPVKWGKRKVEQPLSDSLLTGTTYLSVYSQIYNQTEHRRHALTTTVSLRNTNVADTIYVLRAEYYNTDGHSVRKYFDWPVFIAPMEAVEIVIDEIDLAGGTSGNFLFDWAIEPHLAEPIFEAVMISTANQQGLSFSTQGKRIG